MSKKIPNKITKNPAVPVTGKLFVGNKSTDYSAGKKGVLLYQLVYSSKFSFSVILLLLMSFSLQSAERVFASENLELPLETASDSIEFASEEVLVETVNDMSVPELTNEALSNQSDFEQTTESEIELVSSSSANDMEIQTEESTSTELVLFEESIPLANESLENISSTSLEEIIPEPDTTEIEVPSKEVFDDQVDTNTEADNTLDDENKPQTEEVLVADHVTTSTEDIMAPVLETTHEIVSVTNSDSEFSFTKNECTELANGSFYCLQPKENQLNDALFSGPDSDGDLEIFLIRNGVQVQVTNNQVDDAAPYYDQNSNTVVWHRLIDDRYQIISFDPESKDEVQISRTAENNMEPTRQGEYTVWQRWIDGGWNIILFDGEKELQITKDNSHNVAPYMHGSLVVWNSRDLSGEKTIRMFDIESKTYVTVDDPEGLSVSNPRMVFVYDSLHPNGDIVTKGYDVMARKFIDLDSLPRSLPEELPSSDSTGETRALIQSKPTVKSEIEDSLSTSSPEILPPIEPEIAATSTDSSVSTSSSTFAEIVEVEISAENVSSMTEDTIEPFLLDGVPI